MSDIGWHLPECMVTGDHLWRGGSTCSACGVRLRCACGQYVTESNMPAHFDRCPVLTKAART